jgi:hypothetical protein
MSFSAVTCLTFTGNTPLGGVFNIYSNVDSFNFPIQTNIDLSAITGNQCPYYLDNIPDGTTQIRLYDIGTGCYCDVPVNPNDLCTTCEFNFSNYSASTVGRIVAGTLIGPCESLISDYRIYWYETGNTTTPAYISGYGTAFTPYNFTHPLTGTSSIFAQSGTYIPIIDKIKLSDFSFSQTGGTGYIPAELDCFTSTTVSVDAFTCSNGTTSNDPNYTHRVNFLSAAAGTTPTPLESTFLFTATTNYFAWKFKGFNVPDRLRLTYNGSAYPTPIILEDMVIGDDSTISNFNLNLLPKTADTVSNFYVKKVLCLTGLTRNIGDSLKLEVIPNSANTQTNWDFYFTCLNTFNQDTKLLNNPFKISASTISSTDLGCNTIRVAFIVSGLTKNFDDFSKYIVNDEPNEVLNGTTYRDYNIYSTQPAQSIFSLTPSLFINRQRFTITYPKYNMPPTCNTPSTNIITYQKYVSGGTQGVIDMTFNSIVDLNTYYNSYKTISGGVSLNNCLGTFVGPWSGTPFDPTNVRYYRYYNLYIPTSTGSTNCGDGTTSRSFRIHPSTVVTTGTTGPNYTLRFTMPTVINGLTYTSPCATSSFVESEFINGINSDSTGTTNNFTGTTLTGSKYIDPFAIIKMLCSGTTTQSGSTIFGYFGYPKYLNETIPYTGATPSTIAPTLSAKTFNFDYPRFTLQNTVGSSNLSYYNRYGYYYPVILNNPSDYRDFQIFATPFTGGTIGPSSSNILIYSYSGVLSAGTIIDSSYFI